MASNSYTLEVIANTAKYQSELAKIPGLTEKQAAAAALKMANAQEKAQQKMAADAEKYARQAADAQEAAFDEAAQAAEEAARRQSEAAEKAADGFGKVGESAGKLGGVLEMLGVEGASTIADLADAGEVASQAMGGLGVNVAAIGRLLGPLAVVVGLVGGAMWVMADAAKADSAAMEESRKKAEELAAALEVVNEAHRQTSAVFQDTANELAVATGGMEDYELAASNAAKAVRDGAQAEIDALTVLIAKTQMQLITAQAMAAAGSAMDGTMAEGVKNSNALSKSLKEQEKQLADLMYRTDDMAGRVSAQIIQEGEAKKAKDEHTASTKRATVATTDLAAAEKERAAALATLAQIEQAANRAMMTSAAQTAASLQDQLQAIDALEAQSGDAAAAQAARNAVQQKAAKDAETYAIQQVEALQQLTAAQTEGLKSAEEVAAEKLALDLDAIDRQANMAAEALRLAGATEAQITDIYQQAATARQAAMQAFEAARQESSEGEAEDTKKEAEDTQKYLSALAASNAANLSKTLSGYMGTLGNMTQRTEDAIAQAHARGDEQTEASLKRRLKAQKRAALVGFRIQQATDIAQATTSTVKGSIDAFNSVIAAVPYPANLILAPVTAGLVATAGAAQIASIASSPPPSFRTGGVVPSTAPSLPGGYQDQRLISAEPGERVYNKQESAVIDRMLSGGGGPVVIQQVYRGRVVGEVVADELQRAGRLRSALGSRAPSRVNPYIR